MGRYHLGAGAEIDPLPKANFTNRKGFHYAAQISVDFFHLNGSAHRASRGNPHAKFMNMPMLNAYIVAIIGNMIPVPFIYFFAKKGAGMGF